MNYSAMQRFKLFDSIDLFNFLIELFNTSFKKCQAIYLNVKTIEEDSKISQVNVENHNKQNEELEQQVTQNVSNVTINKEKDVSIENPNQNDEIKGFN